MWPQGVRRIGEGRRPVPGLAGNDGQEDVRGVARVVKDRLPGGSTAGSGRLILPRVEVAIEAREVARRDLEPDPMARQEDVAGGPEVDGEARDLARGQECRSHARVAVAGADD